jgi:DNA-binding transcriptional LysR family regulator
MLNLNQLRVFYEAAKHQSFTEAAHRLFVTQPAITGQVKSFENQCKLKLFKQKGRKICLTHEGETLYECVKKIFECEKEAENLVEEMREMKRGILRIGTTKVYARYCMPLLISNFKDAYPNIKVFLDEGNSLDILHSLVELKNEVALVAMVENNPEITFIPFSRQELVLIAAPDHDLVHKKSLTMEELAMQPIIMREVGSGTREQVNKLFSKKGLVPNVLMETNNIEFIKQFVQWGDGISFVRREAVAAELKEEKLAALPLEGKQMSVDVNIAYLKHQALSLPARVFVDMLKKLLAEAA